MTQLERNAEFDHPVIVPLAQTGCDPPLVTPDDRARPSTEEDERFMIDTQPVRGACQGIKTAAEEANSPLPLEIDGEERRLLLTDPPRSPANEVERPIVVGQFCKIGGELGFGLSPTTRIAHSQAQPELPRPGDRAPSQSVRGVAAKRHRHQVGHGRIERRAEPVDENLVVDPVRAT